MEKSLKFQFLGFLIDRVKCTLKAPRFVLELLFVLVLDQYYLILYFYFFSFFVLGFVLVLVFLFAYAAHCELLVQEGTKGSTELLLWGIRYVISPFLSFFLLSIEKVKQLKKKKNQSLK